MSNNIIQNTANCETASRPQGSRRSADGRTRRYIQSGAPRLKWSEDLHRCFVWAIEQLGGPQKATPKAILREMNISGLKLAQVKSHLQMYRCSKCGMKYDSSSGLRRGGVHYDSTSDPDPRVWNLEPRVQGSWMKEAGQLINFMKIIKSRTALSKQNSAGHNFIAASTLDSFGRVNHTISCASLSSPDKQHELTSAADPTPELSEEVYPNLFKILKLLEVAKSGEFGVLGNEELGSRQSPSDLLLAGDTDVAGQCQSAEDLAHDLLMAMSEGEYLKTGSTFISELHKTTHGAIGSEVSYEPLSLGLATSSVDVRPDRSTLDLTGQFSRSHLSLSHPF